MASLFAVNMTGGEVLYLTPCDNWINNAKNNGGGKPGRYAAYFFNNSPKAEAWVAMTQVEGEFYQVTAPSGNFTNVIFCSMNPGSIGLSWNDKWNQTGDLSYDGTKNHYTVKAGTWDKGGGSWSTYTPPTPDPVITIGAAPQFATTTVGETSSATLKYTLENATEATATIEGEGFSISAQEVGSVTIAFAPEAEGDYTGTLTITSGEVKETVALAAKAVAAEAPKVPEFLNVTTPVFAEIIEGEVTTAEVTYELVNATEATASVDGEFFSIKEQELGKVIIEFASEEAGVFEGTLTLTSGETVKEITFTATAKKAPVVITISFVNPDWTEAAIWAWVEGGENLTGGTWPGKAMTKDETTGVFSYALTIPEDGVYSFIINNNNNGLQSVDMTGVTESTCYNLGAKSGEKYNLVVSENCDYTPAPEPEPIDPYVAIRGTMTDWTMANDIKMTYNAEAANGPEWYITAFEVPADGKFKVVSVDAQSQTTWYGTDKVDLQEGITNAGQGDGDIALPAGKYDIYFKVNEGRMWIQKYVAPEEPEKPELNVSAEEVVFDELTLGEEPVSATETIKYEIKNSDEAAVIELESDVFKAEDENGTITITFAPEAEGEYTAELTITLGEIVKTIAISGSAKAAVVPEPESEFALVGRLNGDNDTEILDYASGYKFNKESEFVYTLNVTFTGTIESSGKQVQKVKLVDAQGNIWARNNSKTIYIQGTEDKDVTATMTKGETTSSAYLVTEAGVEYKITYTLNDEKTGGQLTFEKVDVPKPELIVSTEELVFETLILDGEQFSSTETITYEIKNSDEAAVIALESDVFKAEDENGTITITFTPIFHNYLYKAELTITLGDIVKTVAISAVVKPLIDDILLPEFDDTKVGEYDEIEVLYSLHKGNEGVARIEGDPAFEITSQDVGQMFIKFTPLEVKEYTATLIITSGKYEREITLIANGLAPDPEPTDITFTVQVPEGTKECYIAGTPGWTFIQMEKVDGEENLFSITVEKTVLNGEQWKYASGANWQYAEVIEGNGNRTEAEDPYDVVTAWQKLYDPDFQPIDPYYAIRGLNGDASWTGSGDIKLEESADGSEWSALGFTVAEGESFKVIYIDENADVSGYYAGLEDGCDVGQSYDDMGNLVLPAGTYNLYFKPDTELMWISKVDTPTDAEEAIAELIYAVDGTIIAPAPFAIIDLSGKDVTNANGSLQGTYIVKTLNSVTKVSVQ